MSDEMRIGPYELRGELGRGAMARVWRGWDPNLEREVAVKEPLFDPTLPRAVLDEMGRRFVAEGRAAARLNHPGIVAVYAADVWDGRPAIVMELVEGATLSEVVAAGPLAPAEALSALDQLLDAVGYAHARGVVHRDIKPDNVFLASDGRVKLADFGIAHVDSGATRATVAGAVLGTPGYMSPEQARGGEVDARSDIFSIGVVAHEMLTGRNPFGSGEATTLLYRIVHEPAPELPDSAWAGLPADLRPAVMSALAKDPADRPQTAEDMRRMLHGEEPLSEKDDISTRDTLFRVPLRVETQAYTVDLHGRTATASNSGMRPPKAGLPSWAPYAIVGICCVIVLAVVFASANSGGATSHVSTTAVKEGAAAGADAPYYVATSGGFVAIYKSDSAKPEERTDIEITDLDDATVQKLDGHMYANSAEEARAIVESLRTEKDANRGDTSSIIGNLINGGHMAMDADGLFYYADPVNGTDWDTKTIVCCSPDGTNKRTVYRGPSNSKNVYHISIIGNRMVFNQVTDSGSTVVAVSTDGTRAITLDSCDDWSLCQVDNNRVYYLKGGRIWSCTLEGSSTASFANVGKDTLWRVWNGRLITFAEKGGTTVTVSELDGSGGKVAYQAKDGFTIRNAFQVGDRTILVWESAKDSDRVFTVDYATGEKVDLWTDSGGMQRMCASPDDCFVTTTEAGGKYYIHRIPLKGGGTVTDMEVSDPGETRYTSYLHGRVYFGVINTGAGNKCSLHSVDINGADFRAVAN